MLRQKDKKQRRKTKQKDKKDTKRKKKLMFFIRVGDLPVANWSLYTKFTRSVSNALKLQPGC